MKVKAVHLPAGMAGTYYKYLDADGNETTYDKAVKVLVHFDEIPAKVTPTIKFDVYVEEDEVYNSGDKTLGAMTATATFDYITLDAQGNIPENAVRLPGTAITEDHGKYTFHWWTLGGKVFVDSTSAAPNGLYKSADGDALWAKDSFPLKDQTTGKIYTVPVNTADGTYSIKLQPRKEEYKLNAYLSDVKSEIEGGALDANDYRITLDTHDNADETNNNNAPRNHKTDGFRFTYDIHGQTGIDHVKDFDKANIGLYWNPDISVNKDVTVRVGANLDFKVTPTFGGHIQANGIKDSANGTTYGSFATTLVTSDATKTPADVVITGNKQTKDSDGALVYFPADVQLKNFFGEEYIRNIEYRVWDATVSFEKDNASFIGKWTDGSTDAAKSVQLDITSAPATQGGISAAKVPGLTSDTTGYEFTGWTTYRDGSVVPELAKVTDFTGKTFKDGDVLRPAYAPITYKVVFEKNTVSTNGENLTAVPSGTMAEQTLTYDKEEKLQKNKYSVTGYDFEGWKDEDGNVYQDEQAVKNLTATKGETIRLTAQWKAREYDVLYEPNTVDMDGNPLTGTVAEPSCVGHRQKADAERLQPDRLCFQGMDGQQRPYLYR